jgi:hypothetical protein
MIRVWSADEPTVAAVTGGSTMASDGTVTDCLGFWSIPQHINASVSDTATADGSLLPALGGGIDGPAVNQNADGSFGDIFPRGANQALCQNGQTVANNTVTNNGQCGWIDIIDVDQNALGSRSPAWRKPGGLFRHRHLRDLSGTASSTSRTSRPGYKLHAKFNDQFALDAAKSAARLLRIIDTRGNTEGTTLPPSMV